jgi:arabinan endo-1,5-alpha-L-arabinosidase
MKNISISFRLVTAGTAVLLLLMAVVGCTDVQGDGINEVVWEGSVLPEDICYRNPVWEPDLSFPSVFSAAVGFYAVGVDMEWSPGLNYSAPVLSSNDLMNWRLRGEAFTEKPAWSQEKINSIAAGFSKTRGTYYIFYTLGPEGIGMGASKAPQGPFTDFGMLINAASMGVTECANPYFLAFGSKAYLFFQGGDGIYGQEIVLYKDKLAEIKGDKFKVTGPEISSANIVRIGDYYYLFGAVEDGNNSRITLGRSSEATGPYLDSEGSSLLEGEGTPVVTGSAGEGFVAVNHAGGIFEDAQENIWILCQATDIDQPLLSSGSERHPLMLSPVVFSENGWPGQETVVRGGWNYPKFAK